MAQFFTKRVISSTATAAIDVFAIDLDGDGDIDVLSASRDDDKIAWYENKGQSDPTFDEHIITTNADGAFSVFAIDLDGDTDIDVLSGSAFDNKIAWYRNDGSENFTLLTIAVDAMDVWSVFAADVDGDGPIDVLSASPSDSKIAWYRNEGPNNFDPRVVSTTASSAREVFAADLDGDEIDEVISASGFDDRIAWYDASDGFMPRDIATDADLAISVFAIDLDGDDDIDVLSASRNDDKIAWYENLGSGNFQPHTIATSADGARSVFAVDVDGDGDIDVLSASRNDDKIAWYDNDGSESFTARDITTSADFAYTVFAADLDGDGDTDVLSASTGDNTIAWYENEIPTVSLADASVVEGDSGNSTLTFTATLRNAAPGGFTIPYTLSPGTAEAETDYEDIVDPVTLTFNGTDGETRSFTVDVLGDALVELDEDLFATLGAPSNSQVALADSEAIGTISNDDSADISIDNVSAPEGDSGTTSFQFTVTLDADVDTALSVDFGTQDDTATVADGDYAATNGRLNFAGNAEQQPLTVLVNGDGFSEGDEQFAVVLANLQAGGRNVALTMATGIGEILDDDPEIDVQRPVGASILDGSSSAVGDKLSGGRTNLIYTIENTGGGNLSIDPTPVTSNLANVSSMLVEDPLPAAVLEPGDTTSLTLSFQVDSDGPFSFDLAIGNSDVDENPYDIQVTGNGVNGDPEIGLSREIAIGDGKIDDLDLRPATPQQLTYTIDNSGNVPLSVGVPDLSNPVNVTGLEVSQPPSDSVATSGQTTFALAFTPVAVGPFSFDVSIDNNDANENPYDFQVIGQVPDADLTAELPQPVVLVDNDGDEMPNPTDTIRFNVDLFNSGDTAAGETEFSFVAPSGTSIIRASKANRPGLNDVISTDGTTITATFNDLEGPGSETGGSDSFPGLVSFDLVIDNDIAVEQIELQASFDYGDEIALTNDPKTGRESIDPTFVTIGNINRVIPSAMSQDFGKATAISDDFVAVASPGDDNGDGAVSIYQILGDGRRRFLERIVKPADFQGAGFGTDVSLDGDILVVGSVDPAGATKGTFGNKVALYQLSGDQSAQLVAQITANLDSGFGSAVEIDGSTIVVGAPEQDSSMPDTGAVYLYDLASLVAGESMPMRTIEPATPEMEGRFGAAVACAGGKIIVGSPGPVGADMAGRAAIIDALTGAIQADIAAPSNGSGEFGAAVAIEGDRIAIAAPASSNNAGGVFAYDLQGQAVEGRIESGDVGPGQFGRALSLDNGELFIGAPSATVVVDENDNTEPLGAVYQFSFNEQKQTRKIGAFSVADTLELLFEKQAGFGSSVAVSGDSLLIGAPDTASGRGGAAFQRGSPKDALFSDGFECRLLLGCD